MKRNEEKSAQDMKEDEILKKLDPLKMPLHIAVIMDGNRRWAKEKDLPSIMGHRAGVKSFRKMVETCVKLGIKYLTAYAFSKENWKRPEQEVSILLKLFEVYSKKERENLRKNGVRFRTIGMIEELPKPLIEEFKKTEELTKENDKLVLNLAVNYGARAEMIKACSSIASDVKNNTVNVKDIDEVVFSRYLYTGGQPDPDLLIRTSGELRISNFLLWQLAYTELHFTSLYWPDFTPKDLMLSILDFQGRERRFGGTKSQSL